MNIQMAGTLLAAIDPADHESKADIAVTQILPKGNPNNPMLMSNPARVG